MDPFEEFEFKPLTDGLGFHKKKQTDPAPAPILKDQGLELIEDSSTDPLRPPLPRKKSTQITPNPGSLTEVGGDGSTSAAVDEILKTLQKNRRLDFEKSTEAKQQMTSTPRKDEFKAASFSLSATLLDAMLVIAAGLLCMIILLVVTRVDLIRNLSNPDAQGMIYLSTLSLFAGVAFIYLTVNRIFMGCTPGEWAFDQRVGLPEELNKASYSLRVVARSFIIIATGFVIIPFLSMLFNKDIAGAITGARLYKKV